MQISTMEKLAMDSSPQGGVINLLRMARTQCGVAVAFAALRRSDGSFALATFPTAGHEGPWSIEAIDEIVHQTWSDPHLGGGRVIVRTGRVPGGDWPGQNHQSKLAVAPLSDLATTDRPWGLLAVADPTSGQFEQDHLDLLGSLAVRLTAYLRARQEVVENVFTVVGEALVGPEVDWDAPSGPGRIRPEPTEPSVTPAPSVTPGPSVISPSSTGSATPSPEPTPVAGPLPPPVPEPDQTEPEETMAPEPVSASTPAAAPAPHVPGRSSFRLADPRTHPAPEPPPLRPEPPREHVDASEIFGSTASLPVVEWYRGATRTSGTGAVPAFPQEHDESPQHSDPLSDTPAGGRLEIQTITDAGDVLGTMMGPDPLTGLAGLPSVLVHLGGAVATLHRATVNSVAVVLVDVRNPGPGTPPIPDAAFSAVANRLKNHVRNGDIVGRIGQGTIAVIANVRTGPEDGSIIERRLVEAARNALPGAPEASVRSALTSAFGDTALGAEDLLRQAIAQLAAL